MSSCPVCRYTVDNASKNWFQKVGKYRRDKILSLNYRHHCKNIGSTMRLEEYLMHLKTSCAYYKTLHCHDCNSDEKFNMQELIKHKHNCRNSRYKCKICFKVVFKDEITNHICEN